jgi:L-amino acid N-acyltransferase YncA
VSPPTIRPAQPDDLAAIQAIYAHHVRHGTGTFELDPPDLAEMRQRFDALIGGGYPYLAAEEDGVITGYAYAGPFRARPAYRYTVEDSIYLHPAHCGRGLGRRLLDQLIIVCLERDYHQMLAVIGDSANQASVALHRATGFSHVGTFPRVGYKFDRWLDVVLMQRELAPR